MSEDALKYINNLMSTASVPYRFMQWSGQPPDPYFVGEYLEEPSQYKYENGYQSTAFILRGFTKKSWAELETAKAAIESVMATTAILPNGNGIAVFYESAGPVPTGDADLKSIKINLEIQEWSVN